MGRRRMAMYPQIVSISPRIAQELLFSVYHMVILFLFYPNGFIHMRFWASLSSY